MSMVRCDFCERIIDTDDCDSEVVDEIKWKCAICIDGDNQED
jgi:hypothetical protein